jgi:hypothetical protein
MESQASPCWVSNHSHFLEYWSGIKTGELLIPVPTCPFCTHVAFLRPRGIPAQAGIQAHLIQNPAVCFSCGMNN